MAHLSHFGLTISFPIFKSLYQRSQLLVAIPDNTACTMMNGDNSGSIGGAEFGRFSKRLCERYVQYLVASTRVGWLQKESHLEDPSPFQDVAELGPRSTQLGSYMKHEAPLNCSCQIAHTGPRKIQTQKFPSKTDLGPIIAKFSSKFILNFPTRYQRIYKSPPAHHLYYPGGSTLHMYTIYTCFAVHVCTPSY